MAKLWENGPTFQTQYLAKFQYFKDKFDKESK
jgi:hypothetical protein